MAFKMNLWQVNGTVLTQVKKSHLDSEERLENWIEADPSMVGLDILIIGRQVVTDFRGRVDLLGIDEDGNLVILELKRNRTPRDIVAQVLDYASWVKSLSYQQINEIAHAYLKEPLPQRFNSHFDTPLPETINVNHSMLIIASELDDASERIVHYLASEHDVNINAIFFNFYITGDQELVGRAWLMDPAEIQELSASRKQAPWSGYYFVNVGDGEHRTWEDNCRYGYIGAGQGRRYAQALQKLHVGDKIFAYMKGLGYVGYGEVTKEAVPISEFVAGPTGEMLLELPLRAPKAHENLDNPDLSEWVVGVQWIKTFPRGEAQTFNGVFANQNIVCKLRQPETVQFVKQKFEVEE